MKYYCIAPEVAGGIGSDSILNTSVHPPIVSRLHYEFDGWLGDDLLESFPCYIVSETLKNYIEQSSTTGYLFAEVKVTKSSQFEELYPNRDLPVFFWLKIVGRPSIDDFSLSAKYRLVVSEKALEVLKNANLSYCEIEQYSESEESDPPVR